MKIMVATDVSIYVCNDRYYASQVSNSLKRYYENYGRLVICARVTQTTKVSSVLTDVTHMFDKVVAISSLGKAMLGAYNRKIQQAVSECALVVCRCHGIIAFRAADAARKCGKPYFSEVVGCAWDAYWNHSLKGKLIAPYMFFKMKKVVKNADYALYVTSEFLQKRYPCKNESVGVSDVLISDEPTSVLEQRLEKIKGQDFKEITLVTTAAVNVRYKGQQYVIRAIPRLNKKGVKIKYVLIGGGDDTYLRSIAKKCGVEDQVVFAGRQPLEKVFEIVSQADIYVQPSLQEGLPRSVVEAMSKACPVIGARTAGIPELIPTECVVKRKSSKQIVDTVLVMSNKETLSKYARLSFEKSKEFLEAALAKKRTSYYKKMQEDLRTKDVVVTI